MGRELFLVGIGTGSPGHLTREGSEILRRVDAVLLPDKGAQKAGLAQARLALLEQLFAAGEQRPLLVHYAVPARSTSAPYLEAVEAWHDALSEVWTRALSGVASSVQRVAVMVWGDPSLYDSSLRIASRLRPQPLIRIVPGITALQALTAAHAIPLNTLAGTVHVTTGRRLRREGWPTGADSVAVLLDSQCSFRALEEDAYEIWWGAYLGLPQQILRAGPTDRVADEIVALRATARAEHGWIMDTYLLRRLR